MDIFTAIAKDYIHYIQEMIIRDPSVVHHTQNHWTPLHFACRYNQLEIARLLIEAGADTQKHGYGVTPLHVACEHNCFDIVLLLLQTGAGVHVKNNHGRTPLHYACRYGHIALIQLLIESGADVHMRDMNGFTPLHAACQHGCTETIQFLIEIENNRADWLAISNENKTPVDLVIENNKIKLLTFLGKMIDRLPVSEAKKIQAWRFRLELSKTS